MHRLLAVGFAAATALSTSPANAEAALCASQLAAVRPADLATDVPLNVQLVAREDGCGGGGFASFELSTGGTPVELQTGESRFESRRVSGFTVARPVTELLPNTDYVLQASGMGELVTGFRTGTRRVTATTTAPAIEVLHSECTVNRALLQTLRNCDHALRLTPPPDTTGDRGMFHVDGLTAASGSRSSTATYFRDSDQPFETNLFLAFAEGETERCFTLVYEDSAGNLSPESARACAAIDDAQGCSAAGAPTLWATCAAALLVLRRRRP